MGWLTGRGGETEHDRQIAALEKAVEGLESKLRLIKVEWESVLDKVNSVMGRLNARIRKFESTSSPESDDGDDHKGAAPPPVLGSHSTLTAMRGRRRGVLPG